MLRPPVVLAYHGVGAVSEADDPRRLVLHPRLLDEQLDLLGARGYRFLTAEDLLDECGGARPAPGTAVLTFDDGWLDATTAVLPLLRRRGIPATFYLCPGWLGGQHPDVPGPAGRLLAPADVARLAASGMEVASHSLSHRDLRLLGDDELACDLSRSRGLVEELSGRPCRTFAYPYGLHDERVEAAVAGAGYELALTWGPGPWRPLATPRLPAPPRHGRRRLALKLMGVRRPRALSA